MGGNSLWNSHPTPTPGQTAASAAERRDLKRCAFLLFMAVLSTQVLSCSFAFRESSPVMVTVEHKLRTCLEQESSLQIGALSFLTFILLFSHIKELHMEKK